MARHLAEAELLDASPTSTSTKPFNPKQVGVG